ncbi:MAG: Mov34/MPN/PAD-1 family protein [Planctomycetota bacterium]
MTLKTIALSPRLREQIHFHGIATFPNECCGFLLAELKYPMACQEACPERIVVSAVVPSENLNTTRSNDRFDLAPQNYANIESFLDQRRKGFSIVGIYHTHPRCPAYASATDTEWALGTPELFHLIQSIRDDGQDPAGGGAGIYPGEIKAFRVDLEAQKMIDVALDIDGRVKP